MTCMINLYKTGANLKQAPSSRVLGARRPDNELDDIPSDAFDSSPVRPSATASRLQQNYRQTTLWGKPVSDSQGPSQVSSGRPYRGDTASEPPTHHELDSGELVTWVYPTNLGPTRDYQFSIVKSSLFKNTLVALPTGLGKTFIAATVILNFFRWTKKGKIIFVAPTKPLASQQVEACLNVAGIPRSQATLLTGETAPVLREDEWATKRLFFMTPQTLINDLSKGYADPKSIVLLVVDEAHRATGDYAYVKVVEFLRRFSQSFRVLALTATPGSTVEAVQEVIDNLGISHVEIRTEESLDIRQYVHSRNIDTIVLDPSEEIMLIRELYTKTLKPLVDRLASLNSYYNRDPMGLTQYTLVKAQRDWMNGPGRHANEGTKGMIRSIFATLTSLAHGIKLLNFHGIKPFYDNLVEFRSTEEEKGGKGSKYRRQILEDKNFREMMDTVQKWLKLDNFIGHPKLTYLCDTLLNHFMDAGEGSSTRAIVFSEYRDSAEEIVRLLNTHKPLISATVFVGQADSKRSEGMKQKQQIQTIEQFKNGVYNVLVATSIGEEGLDIGQVDLIICYDASASPIRMLQRMGRTGRKRAGSIVLLLMKGKEEESFAKAKDNYSKMQAMICEGSRFEFRHDLSTRIVPRDIKPAVEMRHVDIPIENTQNTSLPEPKKSAARLAKKPAKKKFNMPDGVETGFTTASASFFGQSSAKPKPVKGKSAPVETDFLADVPRLADVVLKNSELAELDRLYRQYPSKNSKVEEISAPRLDGFPAAQRLLRPTAAVQHSDYTRRWVKLFRNLGASRERGDRFSRFNEETDISAWRALRVPPFASENRGADHDMVDLTNGQETANPFSDVETSISESLKPRATAKKTRGAATQRRKPQRQPASLDSLEDGRREGGDRTRPTPARRGRGKSGTGRGRGRSGFRGRGDALEEVGDDCTRTSDMEASDDSDSGADLEGFIVDDNIPSSMLRSDGYSSPISCSPGPESSNVSIVVSSRKKTGKPDERSKSGFEKPFYVPMEFTQTQDSDNDMPDLDDLFHQPDDNKPAQKRSGRQDLGLNGEQPEPPTDNETDGIMTRKPPAKKRRQILLDSDDDDDDDD